MDIEEHPHSTPPTLTNPSLISQAPSIHTLTDDMDIEELPHSTPPSNRNRRASRGQQTLIESFCTDKQPTSVVDPSRLAHAPKAKTPKEQHLLELERNKAEKFIRDFKDDLFTLKSTSNSMYFISACYLHSRLPALVQHLHEKCGNKRR